MKKKTFIDKIFFCIFCVVSICHTYTVGANPKCEKKDAASTQDRTTDLQFTRLALYHWAIEAWKNQYLRLNSFPNQLVFRKTNEYNNKKRCLHAGSNYGPPVYKTGALPLSYRGFEQGSFSNEIFLHFSSYSIFTTYIYSFPHFTSSKNKKTNKLWCYHPNLFFFKSPLLYFSWWHSPWQILHLHQHHL